MSTRIENDTLVGNIGNLPITLHANETDELVMWYPLGREQFTFEIEDRTVEGATIRSFGGYAMRYTKTN